MYISRTSRVSGVQSMNTYPLSTLSRLYFILLRANVDVIAAFLLLQLSDALIMLDIISFRNRDQLCHNNKEVSNTQVEQTGWAGFPKRLAAHRRANRQARSGDMPRRTTIVCLALYAAHAAQAIPVNKPEPSVSTLPTVDKAKLTHSLTHAHAHRGGLMGATSRFYTAFHKKTGTDPSTPIGRHALGALAKSYADMVRWYCDTTPSECVKSGTTVLGGKVLLRFVSPQRERSQVAQTRFL